MHGRAPHRPPPAVRFHLFPPLNLYSSLCTHQLCHEWFSFTHWTSPFSCKPRIFSDYVWVWAIISFADRTWMLLHLSLRYKMKVYSHTHTRTQLVVTACCLPSKLSFWALVCHCPHWTEQFFSQVGGMRSRSSLDLRQRCSLCVCVWHDDGWQAPEWWCVIYIKALWVCVWHVTCRRQAQRKQGWHTASVFHCV